MSEASDALGFEITVEDMQAMQKCVVDNPLLMITIPHARYQLAQTRFNRVSKEAVKFLKSSDPAVIHNAIEHNFEALKVGSAIARPDRLISVLRAVDVIAERTQELDVLSIGPRSEAEIFGLIAAGFSGHKVRAIDLISYSAFIELGDMHSIPHSDKSFDLVILGWVLGYSNDNQKVVEEVLRVSRPGAVIAIGCEYNPKTNEELAIPGSLLDTNYPRYYHTDDLLKLFEGKIETVFFRHDVHPSRRDKVGSIMTVFQLK